MVIVKLMGGLGNQMFQYAVGRRVAVQTNTQLKLDLTFLKDRSPRQNFTYRDYELDLFNIKAEIASEEETRDFQIKEGLFSQLSRMIHLYGKEKYYVKEALFALQDFAKLNGPIYLDGFWQNEAYFRPVASVLREDLTFKSGVDAHSLPLHQEIKRSESICLHVRRTDYVTNAAINQFHGTCSLEYYQKAMEVIANRIKNPAFFIFSDDPEWCKANIQIKNYPSKVIGPEHDGTNYQNKFKLMTDCRHFIIANSSFSWWAAWLGHHTNKVVVAPQRWFKDERKNRTSRIVPKEWAKV